MEKEIKDILNENRILKKENQMLKNEIAKLKQEASHSQSGIESKSEGFYNTYEVQENSKNQNIIVDDNVTSKVNKYSTPGEKVKLYSSLFKGRTDVYAEKFIHTKTGKVGYAPKKRPYWERTDDRPYEPYTLDTIQNHLRGKIVTGIFPLTNEDNCFFLAIDLDGREWRKDTSAIREVCNEFGLPVYVERSQSGNGAHCWFFFETEVKASLARKMGTEIINQTMMKRHELDFASYDRMFPNQDTVPKGGLGNLIALPLQKQARKTGNSLFIDENFTPYEDQWEFLAAISKITADQLFKTIERLTENDSSLNLGNKGYMNSLNKSDFPKCVHLTLNSMVSIQKKGISSRALSYLKWTAAFYNPEFYQLQAMRRSTYRVQRVITCHEESQTHIMLPRGLYKKITDMLSELNIEIEVIDDRSKGNKLDVSFTGNLRKDQTEAVERMLKHNTGVLCGTTAFGKTVAALNIIAEKKVNTLILVNKVSLANQWRKRIAQFLKNEESGEESISTGQLGGGKKNLTNKLDVALLQSLYRNKEVHDCVSNYGMIIVDECHHISAFSFEKVLKNANAKFVYGLTATPKRKDGHHPIIHMQCGDIRYQNDARKVAEERPFAHVLIPRFTPFDPYIDLNSDLQTIYSRLVTNDQRNRMVVEDCVSNVKEGRNGLILTERIEHLDIIKEMLKKEIRNVYILSGSQGKKKNDAVMQELETLKEDDPFVIISTGKYIGEGFDDSRLDTLLIAMPFSYKGRLQQYAGRLHRLREGKTEVRIYDYVDIHVPLLERMYLKRLRGYGGMGYDVAENTLSNHRQLIYSGDDYYKPLVKDMINSSDEVIISSPILSEKQVTNIIEDIGNIHSKVSLVTNTSNLTTKEEQRMSDTIIGTLLQKGIKIIESETVSQCFIVIDQSIIWYGSIELFGKQYKNRSFMRIESTILANEVLKIVGRVNSIL